MDEESPAEGRDPLRKPDLYIVDDESDEMPSFDDAAEAHKCRRGIRKYLREGNPDGVLPELPVRPVWIGAALEEGGEPDPEESASVAPSPFEEERSGAALIAAERRRQIEEKGYTAEDDDDYTDGELLVVAGEIVVYVTPRHGIDLEDPWGIVRKAERKFPEEPGRTIRLLTVAGALLAAEIDRRQRLEDQA